MGIMVPMVETAEQASHIVRYAKYPPEGQRGAAFGVAHDDYSGGDVANKIKSANSEVLLIAQIETTTGLENVDAIAATSGIDVLWVGLYDLTNFLGIPGQMTHPRVDEAIKQTIDAANRHGKSAAVLVGSVEEGKRRLAQGFRCIAYSGDIWLYQRALSQGLRGLREDKS
jgi:2-dehydro-3-deoxyglucarate aldolase/4-hydroxy-2-oxoheptanedioate aldolase